MVDNTPPPPDPYFNLAQASRYLGNMAPSSLRQHTAARRIACYKPGKNVLYRKSDLDAFVEPTRRKTIEELNQELEQKRLELTRPASGITTNGKGGRSCSK
jgi:hypothetical protein